MTMLDNARRMRKQPTPAERSMWRLLRRGVLGAHFCRQIRRGPYIVDFCCRQQKIVVEVEGGIHFEQVEYDQRRMLWLEQRGYQVLRFRNEEVLYRPELVIDVVRSHLA